MAERTWNKDQLAAITSFGGNLLVSAAAGSGKTSVLVERVIRMLTDEKHPVDADKMLIVTFTRLAAAEMRGRISAALAELYAKNPSDSRLGRQLILMERAHIGTIDSFCADIVKEYAAALGLPPEPTVGDEDEIADISFSALEEVIEEYYAAGDPAFGELCETLGGGRSDQGLNDAVTTLYNFISAMPRFENWLSDKAEMYEKNMGKNPFETPWGKALYENAEIALNRAVLKAKILTERSDELGEEKLGSTAGKDCAVLSGLGEILGYKRWDSFRAALSDAAFETLPRKCADPSFKEYFKAVRGDYKETVAALQKDFAVSEAGFMLDIIEQAPTVRSLFNLTADYAKRFGERKREKQLLDYSDLEQMTLAVLSDENGAQTDIARKVASRFEYVLVDECQDINEVQESIINAVSKGDNLFFVGDVKQSIYRFRQAMPELFLQKRKAWPVLKNEEYPATVILGQNYRSRKNIAGAVNFLFEQLMSEKSAEIEYNEEEALVPAATFPEDGLCRNEILLTESKTDTTKDEAAAVAGRIRTMIDEKYPVVEHGETRPIKPSDICILFRSPKGKTEAFLSALRAQGISCRSEKDSGFLGRPEIAAVLDVLKAVDNPLLDIPLAGAMLSEMFGFTPEEMAVLRAGAGKLPLYNSVKAAAENGDRKAADFIKTLDTLRRAAAYERSDAVIEQLYEMTSFPQMMRSCPEGELKLGNLRLLVKYAADREKAGAKGLSSFMRFISRLEDRNADLKPAGSSGAGDAVRIMSVHGSKGLEFPVVFLCGTAKKFKTERSDKIMLHPRLGIAFQRRDPEIGIKFDTAPMLALKKELRRYNLAEEMRILYVALTRAKETLVLSVCDKNIDKSLGKYAYNAITEGKALDYMGVISAKSEAEWLLTALLRHPDCTELRRRANCNDNTVLPDETPWEVKEGFDFIGEIAEKAAAEEVPAPDMEIYSELKARANWVYPYKAAETIPTKAGVSELTHREMHRKLLFAAKPMGSAMSGAARGTAQHSFMQFCDFGLAKADPAAEIKRLADLRFITEKEAESINPAKVKAFFESGLYKRIEKADKVWRELRFLRALPAKDLGYPDASAEDKITVQGVADCVFEENGKLTVVDYKTDFVDDIEELRTRYKAQLDMYKTLLSESMGKPVTEAIIWSFKFGKELEV